MVMRENLVGLAHESSLCPLLTIPPTLLLQSDPVTQKPTNLTVCM